MSTEEVEAHERPFDPSKFPLSEAAQNLSEAFRELIEKLESRTRARRPADRLRFEQATTALALDLTHWYLMEPEGWLYVSLSKADYSPKARPAPFLTERFPDLLRALADARLIDMRKGFRGEFGAGRRTTIRAAQCLRDLIKAAEVSFGDIGRAFKLQGDPLVLRTERVRGKANDLPLPESKQVEHLREEMNQVNAWLLDAVVDWQPSSASEKDPDTGYRFMRRHFTGSLDGCGRLNGGFWQRMSKDRRLRSLEIDCCEPVELDYGQIGIRIAYSVAKAVPPQGDLYAVPGLERHRGGVKVVLNALLARKGPSSRFPIGLQDSFPPKMSFKQVLALVTDHHGAIAHLFGSSFYLIQQRVESTILLTCIHRMMAEGIHGFPNHDCLLVAWDDAPRVKQIMEETAYTILGLPVPVDVAIADGHERLLPSWASDLRREGAEGVSTTSALTPALAYTPTVSPSAPHKRGE